jgi:hypothetical protein
VNNASEQGDDPYNVNKNSGSNTKTPRALQISNHRATEESGMKAQEL